MKLFEFKIRWKQDIVTFFDQDDSKKTGEQWVETDCVRIVADDKYDAITALERAFTHSQLEVLETKEHYINIIATHNYKTITSVKADRVIK